MKITAVVGSYRKGGIVEQTVDELLAAAAAGGAEVRKVWLPDRHLEFCNNCRSCTQSREGRRGVCPIEDDLAALLDELEACDAIILASPVNFGTVTAVMKRFLERFVCYAYWPWGARGPAARAGRKTASAVLIAAASPPSLLARLFFPVFKPMQAAADAFGAKVVGTVMVGGASAAPDQRLDAGSAAKARRLGKRLAAGDVGGKR
ncbi:flavodoxin family protein [Geomesophilobacter sediminis]|uniref:Flavodoxin family protein n=1 Tax=Geomesophilobacter sediminis TaxID=2798584 RepID=A0A8J7J5B2_9BACT|nr:flavodoxin family protein [Geomesophilobacter sediminis]MBJ6726208.1 flavodoxin family protein [Geomesophilobacter sediminis]